MPRCYTVPFGKTEDSAIVDVFELIPADDKLIELYGLFLGQSSDFGDAQAEIIPYKISRGFTTSGSGGSAITPTPIDPHGKEAGFSAEVNNTTLAKEGTEAICDEHSFHVATGLERWWPEFSGPQADQNNARLTIRLLTAPADALTFTGTAYVREF